MIANDTQRQVTEDRERTFARLVERMENGDAESIPDEPSVFRKAKLDATKSVLQELRDELRNTMR